MKALLSIAACMMFVSAIAFGQFGTGSSDVSFVHVVVSTGLVVEGQDITWDVELVPGTTYNVTADGQLSPPDALGATDVTDALFWDIIGQPGAAVLITFGLPGFFVGDNVFDRIPYSVNSQSAGWSLLGAGAIAPGEPYTPIDPRVANTINLNVDGEGNVALGGTLAVPVGAGDTDYTGTFTLTAGYTGL